METEARARAAPRSCEPEVPLSARDGSTEDRVVSQELGLLRAVGCVKGTPRRYEPVAREPVREPGDGEPPENDGTASPRPHALQYEQGAQQQEQAQPQQEELRHTGSAVEPMRRPTCPSPGCRAEATTGPTEYSEENGLQLDSSTGVDPEETSRALAKRLAEEEEIPQEWLLPGEQERVPSGGEQAAGDPRSGSPKQRKKGQPCTEQQKCHRIALQRPGRMQQHVV